MARALSALCLLPPLLLSVCLAGVIPDEKYVREGRNTTPGSTTSIEMPGDAVPFRFPAEPQGKGPLPGAEPALERLPPVADTPAVDPKPALDAPAAVPPDGKPTACERLHRVVAVSARVVKPGSEREDHSKPETPAEHMERPDETGNKDSKPEAQSETDKCHQKMKEEKDRKVSNIRPKNKPMLSDSLLPGVVQVLIHLVDNLEEKELKLRPTPATTTLPPETTTTSTPAPEEESTTKPDSTEGSVITIVQVVPGNQPTETSGLIIELSPNRVPTNSSKPTITYFSYPAYEPFEDVRDIHADADITEDSPIVQRDVPIVSEETVPMMVNMVPSDTPELMVQAGTGKDTGEINEDSGVLRAVAVAADDPAEFPAPVKGTDLYFSEPHKFVYYPTQYFSEEWTKRPGLNTGFLGYKESLIGVKDHVDTQSDGDQARISAEEIIDAPDFDVLKDDGFLVAEASETRGDQSTHKEKTRFKPSKELLKIAKLRFALSSEAKHQNFKKFQGYTDGVVALLEQTSHLTGRVQLGVLLAEVVSRGEIKTEKTLQLAKSTLEDLEKEDSALSKALEGIPALIYSSN